MSTRERATAATAANSLVLLVAAACASGSGRNDGMPADGSAAANGGVRIPGRHASFDAKHELKVVVPEGAKDVRLWFVLPQKDPAQRVSNLQVESPYPYQVVRDSAGNEMLYVHAEDPAEPELKVTTTFALEREEVRSVVDPNRTRPYTTADLADKTQYLEANEHVVVDDRIRGLARDIVGGERNPLRAARKIYDWVLADVDYWVKDPKNKKASPVGSTEHCLSTKTGNCTDFHSLWTSLARAAGIPTRMVYGSFFKQELDGQDTDQSYHCWPEFWVPSLGWIPHDVAVADIFDGDIRITEDNETSVRRTTADGYSGPDRAKVDYYFGNLDERRVTWSQGRDLMLTPPPSARMPVNAMAKAYVEVDGQVHPEGKGWTRKLTFRQAQ